MFVCLSAIRTMRMSLILNPSRLELETFSTFFWVNGVTMALLTPFGTSLIYSLSTVFLKIRSERNRFRVLAKKYSDVVYWIRRYLSCFQPSGMTWILIHFYMPGLSKSLWLKTNSISPHLNVWFAFYSHSFRNIWLTYRRQCDYIFARLSFWQPI